MNRKPNAQRGLSLVFSLLALVALSLGAVALVRSIDLGVFALGNLSDRKAGIAAANRGAEQAMNFVSQRIGNNAVLLNNDVPASGYYSTMRANLDPTARGAGAAIPFQRIDWNDDGCLIDGQDEPDSGCIAASPAVTIGGHQVRYVITRMCPLSGPMNDTCLRPPFNSEAENTNAGCDELGRCPNDEKVPSAYFRIIARAINARGTESFTETMVHY